MCHGAVTIWSITHTWLQIRYMCMVMRRPWLAVATCVHAKRVPHSHNLTDKSIQITNRPRKVLIFSPPYPPGNFQTPNEGNGVVPAKRSADYVCPINHTKLALRDSLLTQGYCRELDLASFRGHPRAVQVGYRGHLLTS